jgi:hypothetical protein
MMAGENVLSIGSNEYIFFFMSRFHKNFTANVLCLICTTACDHVTRARIDCMKSAKSVCKLPGKMFATPHSLKRRTGRFGVNRYEYLKQLIHEYETTDDDDCREQVLANLANFAYDPINYEYFRRLNVIDIFLGVLSKLDSHLASKGGSKLVCFAVSGICNLCNDDKNSKYLLKPENSLISNLLKLLLVPNVDLNMVLNILVALIFLNDESVKGQVFEFFNKNLDECNRFLRGLCQSADKRMSNAVQVFIEDFQIKL